MTLSAEQANWFARTFDQLVGNVEVAVRGKTYPVRLALTCLLTRGHLLLEDNPGTGKTVLARAIAATVQATHSRIQFTPDLLPSDVTGVMFYNRRSQDFEFRPGPIFASIVLADEINRASPKTQSSLLEVMEEGRVTVENETYSVGEPFMVIATQNPLEHQGVYPLPEAQLDRFLMKTSLGYPEHDVVVELLSQSAVRDRTEAMSPVIAGAAVVEMAKMASAVVVDPSLLGYVSHLAQESHRHPQVRVGVSMRGCLSLARCAKTWALSQGRTFVLPDDIKDVAVPVLSHRVLLGAEAAFAGAQVEDVTRNLLADIAAPTGI
jgi:MoxR-like ATPase